MSYLKRIGFISLVLMLFVSAFTISSQAQTRAGVSVGNRAAVRTIAPRRIIIRRNPYFYNGFYGRGFYNNYWGDPFWGNSFYNDPYYTDPRLRALADRVYNEDQVRKAKKDIREYTEKISKDGQITAKEQEKLDKKYRDYDKKVQRLKDGD